MDAKLEKAIDDIGREKLFAFVRSLGWTSPPPKWVWWGAIAELRSA